MTSLFPQRCRFPSPRDNVVPMLKQLFRIFFHSGPVSTSENAVGVWPNGMRKLKCGAEAYLVISTPTRGHYCMERINDEGTLPQWLKPLSES